MVPDLRLSQAKGEKVYHSVAIKVSDKTNMRESIDVTSVLLKISVQAGLRGHFSSKIQLSSSYLGTGDEKNHLGSKF